MSRVGLMRTRVVRPCLFLVSILLARCVEASSGHPMAATSGRLALPRSRWSRMTSSTTRREGRPAGRPTTVPRSGAGATSSSRGSSKDRTSSPKGTTPGSLRGTCWPGPLTVARSKQCGRHRPGRATVSTRHPRLAGSILPIRISPCSGGAPELHVAASILEVDVARPPESAPSMHRSSAEP